MITEKERLEALAPEMARVIALALKEFESLLLVPQMELSDSKPYVERMVRTLGALVAEIEGPNAEKEEPAIVGIWEGRYNAK